MKIGEIAKAAGVSTSRIRFYEREGIIPAAGRSANGYRDYPPELVGQLQFIERAQDLGFTLRELGGIAPVAGGHLIACDTALAMLAAKHDAISALIREAEGRRRRIEALMAELRVSRTEPV